MDELAASLADSLLIESAADALEKLLLSRHGGTLSGRRFRSNAEGVFRLGGIEGVEVWLEARVMNGIGSEDEMEEVFRIQRSVVHNVKRAKARLIKEWNKEQKRHDYEMVWVELLNRRDLNRRAAELRVNADPRDAIFRRLQEKGVVA